MAKQTFLKGIVDTIRLTIYDNNRPIIPTSGTVTLYKPDGSTLQAAAAVTVDPTTGEMTYSLTATHTATEDLNYKAVWAYLVGSTTYYQTQLFDVVLSQLAIPITDEDLYNELESLRKAYKQATGTATAGSEDYITDTKRKEADDFWTGGIVKILSGTGSGQERDITDFVQSTGKMSITPNWATVVSTDSVYVVVKSFTKKIQAAFDKLCQMLYDKGKRDSLILESSQISVPLTYLTIHMIALDLMDEVDDKWSRLAEIYWKKFETSFNTLKLDYDEDESGEIDESEEAKGATEIRIGRA